MCSSSGFVFGQLETGPLSHTHTHWAICWYMAARGTLATQLEFVKINKKRAIKKCFHLFLPRGADPTTQQTGDFYINTFKRTSEVEAYHGCYFSIFSIVDQWLSTNIDDSHRDLPSGVYPSVCLIAWFFSLFHCFLRLLLWVFCAFLSICVCSNVKVVLTTHCAAVKLPVHAGVIVHSALQVGKVI